MTIKRAAEARKSLKYIKVQHESVDSLRKAHKKLEVTEIKFHAARHALEKLRCYWQCRLIDAEKEALR
jgi:hypothetical protein